VTARDVATLPDAVGVGSVVPTPIDVAVGILVRDDGAFLLAQRPVGKPMAGYWEFPGGKLEPGETVLDALVREFDEELSVAVHAASSWVQRVVTYPHATVRLHFWRSVGEARGWSGVPQSNEGQDFRWEFIDRLTTDPWLKGALPVKRWLRLPPTYAISNAADVGVDAFLARLDRALARDRVEQLQLREPALDDATFARLFREVHARCADRTVRLLVNSVHGVVWAERADGIHLTGRDLAACERRPAVAWALASCHGAEELDRAATLELDAAVVGAVNATASHPGATPLGWGGFAAIVRATPLPVYAIGGLSARDLGQAQRLGAHGVAMIRGAWED
jgi:8-oxo-dGTP diphosphatase